MKRKLRSSRVSVSLTSEQKSTLERLAEESGLSLSRLVQEAVSRFIAAHEGEKVNVIGEKSATQPKRK